MDPGIPDQHTIQDHEPNRKRDRTTDYGRLIMSDKIRVLLDEEKVDARIREIGEQISRDYAGRSVHLVCVLKGGTFFMCELAKRITVLK